MEIIESILALALTMLSLAMVATLIVEGFHRLAKTRAKVLKGTLEALYENSQLKGVVDGELVKAGSTADELKKKFIDDVLTNPLLMGESPAVQSRIKKGLSPLVSLSTEDFFKRLAHTEVGRKIKEGSEAEIDEMVDSLSRTYESLGVAATDFFKRRAQRVSFVAGILLALFLNLNAWTLFQTYQDDPLERAKIVAQAQEISQKYQKTTGGDNGAADENGSEGANGKGNAGADENGGVSGFLTEKEAMDYVESLKDEISGLEAVGVAVAWGDDVPPRSLLKEKDSKWWSRLLGFLGWLLGLLGTGMLIGLGGPFWFNIVRKLTDVLQVVRGISQSPQTPVVPVADAGVADPMQVHKDALKKSGEAPRIVKEMAKIAASARATEEADNRIATAKKAVASAKQVEDPDPHVLATATRSLVMATAARERYELGPDPKPAVDADLPAPAEGPKPKTKESPES